ncbi:MAG: YggU family protein [Planctomycetaceae bacterium]|nr:YggU family protein [Planctomycetaceae bacterium]
MPAFRATPDGVLIRLRVQPKSSREGIVGFHRDSLKIAVHAQPEKGKANVAVVEVLAAASREAKSHFTIVAGETARDKHVQYRGKLAVDELRARLLQTTI